MKYKNHPTWHNTYLFAGEVIKEEIEKDAIEEYLANVVICIYGSDAQKIIFEYIENELPELKIKLSLFRTFR